LEVRQNELQVYKLAVLSQELIFTVITFWMCLKLKRHTAQLHHMPFFLKVVWLINDAFSIVVLLFGTHYTYLLKSE
jgi:hypothetical protein